MRAKEFVMAKGLTIRIDAAAGDELRVRTGSVWLTQDSDVNDHVLGAGERFTPRGKGPTVVQALKPTVLEVRRAEPAAAWRPVSTTIWRALGLA